MHLYRIAQNIISLKPARMVFERRFIPEADLPEESQVPKGKKRPQKAEKPKSFLDEAEAAARKSNEAFGKSLDYAAKSVAEGAKAIGRGAAGTVGEVPGVLGDYGKGIAKAREAAVNETALAIEAAVEGAHKAGRGTAEAYDVTTDAVARAIVSLAEGVSSVGRAGWEKARPAVVILVGEGYLAGKSVVEWGKDAAHWNMEALYGAVDWGKFAGRYVEGKTVDTAAVVADLGKDAGVLLAKGYATVIEKTSRGIEMAFEEAKLTGRAIGEARDVATDAVARAFVSIDGGVRGVVKASWEKARPAVVILVGEGYLAGKSVVEWGKDAAHWNMEALYGAVDWGKFAGRYVKGKALDSAALARDFGKDVGQKVADVYLASADAVNRHVEHARIAGEKVLGGPQSVPEARSSGITVVRRSPPKPAAAPKRAASVTSGAMAHMKLTVPPDKIEKSKDLVITVAPGDSLWRIMQKYYGADKARYWEALLGQNDLKKQIVEGKDYPQHLQVGQLLKLPLVLNWQGKVITRNRHTE